MLTAPWVVGINYLHMGAAMAHRDIKPDNIMLCRSDGSPDRVKFVDFGTATDVIKKHSDTQGTMAFFAPELAWDESDDLVASAVQGEVLPPAVAAGDYVDNPANQDKHGAANDGSAAGFTMEFYAEEDTTVRARPSPAPPYLANCTLSSD